MEIFYSSENLSVKERWFQHSTYHFVHPLLFHGCFACHENQFPKQHLQLAQAQSHLPNHLQGHHPDKHDDRYRSDGR